MYKPAWTKQNQSVYTVWTAQNVLVGDIVAESYEEAMTKAKKMCPAPMIRSFRLTQALKQQKQLY